MNKNLIKSATAIAILGGGLILASGQSVAGIANTKHNLGSTGSDNNNFTSATAEICVFCHTPHGADSDAVVPLWNKSLPLATSFTTYNTLGTSTLDGGTLAVGSVSIACLSCHDGAQAMDTVINAPGSGLGTETIGDAADWTGAASGKIGGIANLGADLRNDHPIGIQYGGGGVTVANSGTDNAVTTATLNDPDFVKPFAKSMNGIKVWWVNTTGTGGGTVTTREKQDMQLYTRSSEPYVECASCHDPHVENVGNANPTFLRMTNDGSRVCLACHNK